MRLQNSQNSQNNSQITSEKWNSTQVAGRFIPSGYCFYQYFPYNEYHNPYMMDKTQGDRIKVIISVANAGGKSM